MSITLDIKVTGEKQVQSLLNAVSLRARDLRPVWRHIANDFSALEARQFDTEGGLGKPWPALSPAYAAWKSKHYPGRSMMVLSGDLFSSLVHGGRGHIDRRKRLSLELGTRLKSKKSGYNYGLVHQTRGVGGKVRKTIVVPQSVQHRWAAMVETYLAGGDVFQMMQQFPLFGG